MARPNLLLFMPDQLRPDSAGCFGSDVAATPHIDALASDGVRFDQAFAQHSVCTQSRISMFTGLVDRPEYRDEIDRHRRLLSIWFLETSDVFPWQPDRRLESLLRHEMRPG